MYELVVERERETGRQGDRESERQAEVVRVRRNVCGGGGLIVAMIPIFVDGLTLQ